jgi:rare lipoprotein A
MGADASIRNLIAILAIGAIGLSLAACGGGPGSRAGSEAGGFGRSRGYYKVGAPYQVNGVWYYPRVDFAYDESGTASWYGEAFHGKSTANGETFDLNQVSAAHKTLQLPSVVEVTNLQNGRALKVRVNDRGPFAGDRIIDLSRRAAQLLGFEKAGTAPVRVRILKEESIQVAAAAIRGEIGQTRIAAAPPHSGDTRGGSGSGAVIALAAAAPTQRTPLPATGPRLASEQPAPPARDAETRRPAAIALIGSAQAATVPVATGEAAVSRQQTRPIAPSGRIFVQVGTFAVAENAQRIRARLAPLAGTEVANVGANGVSLYRVRLGPLASESEARRLLDKLTGQGIRDARIVGD